MLQTPSCHHNLQATAPWQDRALAIGLATLLPPLLAWLLLSMPEQRAADVDHRALQVVWIQAPSDVERPKWVADPAKPLPPSAKPSASTAAQPSPRPAAPNPSALQVVEIAAEPTPAQAEPIHRPSSQQLLGQAARAALGEHDAPSFQQDMLANRITAHDQVRDGRFRVREAASPKRVVEGVAQVVFGGNSDPCPDIRADVARHSVAGGNHERLREALRREEAGGCR